MRTTRILMVLAPETFRDEEYSEPRRILESRGLAPTTASTRAGECIGRFGLRVTADISLADAAERPWDCVIFIGGGGASVFFDHRGAHTLARATHAAGGVVAAICIAPSVLARAGLLSGVHATAFPTQQEDLRAHGALWSDDPVCLDGSIITASGPQAAGEFGVSIADALASMDRKGAR